MKTSRITVGLAILIILTASAISAQQEFIQIVTKLNISCNYGCSLIDFPALNDNPAALIFVSPVVENDRNLNPHSIGAYYRAYEKKWSIFNLDGAAIAEGAKFKVEYYLKPDSNRFVYLVPDAGASPCLDKAGFNDNPNAQIRIFPTSSPTMGALYNRDEIKVEYDASVLKWCLANTNHNPVPPGTAFNIVVASAVNSTPKTALQTNAATDSTCNCPFPTSLPPNGNAGGDLSGTYPNPTVIGLQGKPISNIAPTNGQTLRWNGSKWTPSTDTAGTSGTPTTSGPAVTDCTGAAAMIATFGRIPTFNINHNNALFGIDAGSRNTTGCWNSVFGSSSGYSNSTGNVNSFFGAGAGFSNTTGAGNTFVGFLAGYWNRSENFNTAIGYTALVNLGITNATAIGAHSAVTKSNSLVLGSIAGSNDSHYDTNVGIGTSAPNFKIEVIDSSNTGLRVETKTAGGTVASFGGMGGFQVDGSGVVGGRFIITETGNIGINTNDPQNKLDVAGIIAVGSLGSAGATPLCRNSMKQISTCSSSIRYKQNVLPFVSGLSLVKRLRPVSFNWRTNNEADLGLVAEEVKEIEPLLTTTNEKGEVEGVKYDRLGVVLINAVKEQQAQIESQQKQIDAQNRLIKLQSEILEGITGQMNRQIAELEKLRTLICSLKLTGELCKPSN